MSNQTESPLYPLCSLDHPVAELATSFLRARDDWRIEDYFTRRTKSLYENPSLSVNEPVPLDWIDFSSQEVSTAETRLVSLQANYFRGFRKQETPIDLSGDLVVIDGRNSSGKTSLAEAIEWLLTGRLARRDKYDAKEMEDFISNRFRAGDDETWVEGKFRYGSHSFTYRRVLTSDYGKTKTSECESVLLFNGNRIDNSDHLINELFAGVAPLLMQHTLQQFVINTPSDRRSYFEHLLNLDDISDLIEKAVVGDIGIRQYARPDSSETIVSWRKLLQSLNRREEISSRSETIADRERILDLLSIEILAIANARFDLHRLTSVEAATAQVEEMQRQVRSSVFPLLEDLRPQSTLDANLVAQLSPSKLEEAVGAMLSSWTAYAEVDSAQKTISEGQKAIASALESLKCAGLLEQVEKQICPVCYFEDQPTLLADRIDQISQWNEIRSMRSTAHKEYMSKRDTVTDIIGVVAKTRRGLIPSGLELSSLESSQSILDSQQFADMRRTYENVNDELADFDRLCTDLVVSLRGDGPSPEFATQSEQMRFTLPRVASQARKYASAFATFEQYLSAMASTDKTYAARELWLEVAQDRETLLEDMLWERAKLAAQGELQTIRSSLIEYRQRYLEQRRQDFSESMAEIWSKLRGDRYSRFGQIVIPKPSGKGFRIRLEVKATLDSNNQQIEVDALNVMSESQINVIGIAAFLTRSKLLGHKCIVLDDPVQSLDDEHFKTFAGELLGYLTDSGFQVIVLTHNDRFARDISHYHYDRNAYVTMKIKHSRRKGIRITEGNRRVSERLKLAEKLAEEGDLKQAWLTVRLAIERLYLIAYHKYGPSGFNPCSWTDQSAEYMWDAGVGTIVRNYAPGNDKRLKEILGFTAAGAHDKQEQGLTDLMNAVKDIRPLLGKLKVGG